MTFAFWFRLLIGLSIGATGANGHSSASSTPIVHLVSGAPVYYFRHLTVDRGETYLEVESYRTLKRFSLPNLRLIKSRVWKAEIPTNNFHLASTAFSPDGQGVAVGGYFGVPGQGNCALYLWTHRGGPRRDIQIEAMPALLAYSPDGTHLTLGAPYGSGTVSTYDLVIGKWGQGVNTLLGEVTGLDYAQDGRLAVCASSRRVAYNRIGVFSRSGAPLVSITPPIDDIPNEIRFSPDGKELAISSRDKPEVAILDSTTLTQKATLVASDPTAFPTPNFFMSGLTWSSDGRSLYVARNDRSSSEKSVILQWDRSATGWGARKDVSIGRTMITSIVPMPKRDGVAFTTQDGFGYCRFRSILDP